MFNLFKRRETEICKEAELNTIYEKLKSEFSYDNIPEIRKKFLKMNIQKYGYLPYPFQKALDEITNEETLFALEEKWKRTELSRTVNLILKMIR